MSDILLVDKVSKKFKVFDRPIDRLMEALSGGRLKRHREKWALQDISFRLEQGESMGLVGQNGCGKSTLLSIIVGSRAPTSGTTLAHGRVSALLELGMGFHPDFTGRENAIMGLQIQGLSAPDIPGLLPWIEDFSELGEYFENPLRTYSSGMQMRLAFSVATVLKPDILIVDEALSVGDVYFQHKSVGRIRELRSQGASLLFVSHDAASVKSLCDRALLLDEGKMVQDGTPDQVMDYYNAMIAEKEKHLDIVQNERGETRSGSQLVRFESVELIGKDGTKRETFRVGDAATLRCRLRCTRAIDFPTIGFSIRDRLGNEVFGTNSWYLGQTDLPAMTPGEYVVEFATKLRLGVGSYSVTVAAHTERTHVENNYDWWDHACVFQVIAGSEYEFAGVAFLEVAAKVCENTDSLARTIEKTS